MTWAELVDSFINGLIGAGVVLTINFWCLHHDRLYLKGKRSTFFWDWTGFGEKLSFELHLRREATKALTQTLAQKTGSMVEAEKLMKRYLRPDQTIRWAYDEAVKYLDQNKNPRHR